MSARVTIDRDALSMLRASLDRYRASQYTFDQRAGWLERDPGYSEQAWHDYARFGWLAMPLPAAHGGFDGDPVATGALMDYCGRALALEPMFASTVLCAPLIARCAHPRASEWLDQIAAGAKRFALAHVESTDEATDGGVRATYRDGRLSGIKTIVLHGDVADRLIVTARDEADGRLVLCDVDAGASGIDARHYHLIDGRGAASFAFREVPADLLPVEIEATRLLVDVLDEARLALCAETAGAVCALNEATIAFLKTRKQFGRPIGTNQALQHRMVDLVILQEELRAVIAAAHRAFGATATERIRAINGAVAHAATVARQAAHEAVQLHGGMGITQELAVSHYFKRLMVNARLLGDRAAALQRFTRA